MGWLNINIAEVWFPTSIPYILDTLITSCSTYFMEFESPKVWTHRFSVIWYSFIVVSRSPRARSRCYGYCCCYRCLYCWCWEKRWWRQPQHGTHWTGGDLWAAGVSRAFFSIALLIWIHHRYACTCVRACVRAKSQPCTQAHTQISDESHTHVWVCVWWVWRMHGVKSQKCHTRWYQVIAIPNDFILFYFFPSIFAFYFKRCYRFLVERCCCYTPSRLWESVSALVLFCYTITFFLWSYTRHHAHTIFCCWLLSLSRTRLTSWCLDVAL